MEKTIDAKYWGKVYSIPRIINHVKVDERGQIGWCQAGPLPWESGDWRCGCHQHWAIHDFSKFNVVYEHHICLENK